MKIRIVALLSLIAGSFAVASCIDEDATDDVILSNDKASIQEYLNTNTLANVKEYHDEVTGIRVIWQELSGSGLGVEAGDTLKIDYTGRLMSNKVFDTSLEQVAKDEGVYVASRTYKPIEVPIGYGFLIPGFEVGISLMEKGDKATVLIPSLFAYGKQGTNGVVPIPSNAPILFELELKEITQGPQQ
ncbi:FKBP-type peptidyl-prolyl cis-trans isomerase [Algoriphagus persicinus]|uniref:FKBP-type peptidyl-prolyl cis-trans isomerase n=1 Tax=Algoriphagus persicinus TaxID=3108754 RepID=UPI002B38656C|nr:MULTISPECIES: FKBP-type peptidyl-prolyl cis-trans isomerase [unclassified Algoriphagus]MEB2779565.1 FKBP-type peptidyl-prolyl cis-trans isomerase [Algoriphagus sp. C2-6-M1]MEB2786017.1 FKBP-type peptidyl-prolyl cis-trans isomerase [Algoriphagus sp. E1-3-M2]